MAKTKWIQIPAVTYVRKKYESVPKNVALMSAGLQKQSLLTVCILICTTDGWKKESTESWIICKNILTFVAIQQHFLMMQKPLYALQ